MKTTTKKVFAEVMGSFSEPGKLERLLQAAEGVYLLRSFKIQNISAEGAIKSYQRLCSK
jgi:hypothetical protein